MSNALHLFFPVTQCRKVNLIITNTHPPKKTRWLTIVASAIALASLTGARAQGPIPRLTSEKKLALVNVMQGTNSVREFSHGNVLPLQCAPFGMTDWSVQNAGDINERFFFQSRRHTFTGIRATHQPSPWAGDFGHFLINPQSGPLALKAYARASEYDPATDHNAARLSAHSSRQIQSDDRSDGVRARCRVASLFRPQGARGALGFRNARRRAIANAGQPFMGLQQISRRLGGGRFRLLFRGNSRPSDY